MNSMIYNCKSGQTGNMTKDKVTNFTKGKAKHANSSFHESSYCWPDLIQISYQNTSQVSI